MERLVASRGIASLSSRRLYFAIRRQPPRRAVWYHQVSAGRLEGSAVAAVAFRP